MMQYWIVFCFLAVLEGSPMCLPPFPPPTNSSHYRPGGWEGGGQRVGGGGQSLGALLLAVVQLCLS